MAQRTFKSTNGDVVVKSLSGLTVTIGAEPVQLPDVEDLQQAAIAAGCIAVEVKGK